MKTIAQQLNIKTFPFEVKDENGNILYYEKSNGYWGKYTYDENGNEVYYENSEGEIRDNKPKILELTLEDIAKQYNVDVNLIKIKK